MESAAEISYTVAELFNKSLISGEVPQTGNWRTLRQFLRKARSSVCVANYRPVKQSAISC